MATKAFLEMTKKNRFSRRAVSLAAFETVERRQMLASNAGAVPQASQTELIVQLNSQRGVDKLRAQVQANANGLASKVDLSTTHQLLASRGTSLVQVGLRAGADPQSVIRSLQSLPGVASASPNYVYAPGTHTSDAGSPTPNDPNLSGQGHLDQLKVKTAWPTTTGNPNLLVAVFDNGIDLAHLDLQGNLWVNPGEIAGNNIDDDNNGYVDDINGYDFLQNDAVPTPDLSQFEVGVESHGTIVAGLIGAVGNNALQISGIVQEVKLMSVKFRSDSLSFTTAGLISSLNYARTMGVKIMNLSWTWDFIVPDPAFRTAARAVYDAGILWINSAGNANLLNPDRQKMDEVLFVTNVQSNDVRYGGGSGSNYGFGMDLAAPGVDVLGLRPDNRILRATGTSFSSANTTGVAALIWSAHPTWTRNQVAAALVNGTDSIDALNPGFEGLIGTGRVNATASVAQTLRTPRLRAVNGLPSEAGNQATAPATFSIDLGTVFDPATVVGSNFSLTGAGPDNTFGNADDTTIPLTLATPYLIGTNRLSFNIGGTVPAGYYRLTAAGLTDPFGTALDGNADGTVGDAFVRNFSIGTVVPPSPPAAPSSLVAAAVNNARIDLAFVDNSTDETGFVLERATDAGFTASLTTVSLAANAASYSDTSVTGGTTYFYRVRAVNASGPSANSNTAQATTQPNPTTPTPPSNLQATAINASRIDLVFTDNSADETGFILERGTDAAFTGVLQTINLNANVTTYSDTGLASNTTYFYRVRAVNAVGPSADSSVASATTSVDTSIPSPIVDLKLNEGNGTAVANTGSAGGSLVRTNPTPAWSTNTPRGSGGSLDFGTTSGDFAAESPAPISALAGLTRFTISGWLNNRSNIEGAGGNRIVNWARVEGGPTAADGVDLVYKSDGSLMLGIDSFVDTSTARSNAGQIPTSPTAAAGNWRFFAVTYDSTIATGQVKWFFGSPTAAASLSDADTYSAGAVNTNIQRLAVGHFNSGVRSANLDRMFKGLIDGVRIYGSALSLSQVQQVQDTTGSGVTVVNAPTALTATDNAGQNIILGWTDNSPDESSFTLQRATDAGFTTGLIERTADADSTVFWDWDNTPGVTYFYRVRANSSGVASAWSNTASGQLVIAPGIPAAPTGLTATANSTTEIILSWNDVSNNEQEFRIERSTSPAFTSVAVRVASANSNLFYDWGLSPNTTYYYRVAASNGSGTSSSSASASALTLGGGNVAPAAPSNLIAQAASTREIQLTWTDNSPLETEFQIERSLTPAFTSVVVLTAAGDTSTYYDWGLTPATTYYYRIRAANAAGASSYSATATVATNGGGTVAPAAPSGLTAVGASSSEISLNWIDNSNSELSFRIERSTSAAFTSPTVLVADSEATTYYDWGLTAGVIYYYRVRAENTAGVSAYSNTATSTTGSLASPLRLAATPVGVGGGSSIVDNSLSTGYFSPLGISGWAGVDLGSSKSIQSIRFAPRPGKSAQMVNGRFEASNNPNFTGTVQTIHIVQAPPQEGRLTAIRLPSAVSYRYIRFVGGTGTTSIAELQIFTAGSNKKPKATPTNGAVRPVFSTTTISNTVSADILGRRPKTVY